MPAVGVDGDLANSTPPGGGGPGAPVRATQFSVLIGGKAVLRLGDPVDPHGGTPLHGFAVMAEASAGYLVAGIPVCRDGDLASCGHVLRASQFGVVDNSPKAGA
jgi:uncharacterized Zn-binding protein involved in type VI secretion